MASAGARAYNGRLGQRIEGHRQWEIETIYSQLKLETCSALKVYHFVAVKE